MFYRTGSMVTFSIEFWKIYVINVQLCTLLVCLPICLSVHLPACLPICLSVHLPACQSVCLSICMPACLSVCQYLCMNGWIAVTSFFFLSFCHIHIHICVCVGVWVWVGWGWGGEREVTSIPGKMGGRVPAFKGVKEINYHIIINNA